MAEMYEPKSCPYSPADRDDLASFVHSFVRNSTFSFPESASYSYLRDNRTHSLSHDPKIQQPSFPMNLLGPIGYFPKQSTNLVESSDSIGYLGKGRKTQVDMDLDELGCESKGPEATDGPFKPALIRGSSKRSRAAEVHNISEKRRRSRINEKMKALQMLIPNSNKTDKASMLDEAIEYLKQLQLQVQMLMRNGTSLHPVYAPGLQPIHLPSQTVLGFEDGNELSNANGEFSGNQGNSMQHSAFNNPNSSNEPIVIPTIAHIPNSEISFGLERSNPVHYKTFDLSAPFAVCREDAELSLHLDMSIRANDSSDVSY